MHGIDEQLLARLVDKSLDVTIRTTYPDIEAAERGHNKRIQVKVRHPHDPNKTFSVLSKDIRGSIIKASNRVEGDLRAWR